MSYSFNSQERKGCTMGGYNSQVGSGHNMLNLTLNPLALPFIPLHCMENNLSLSVNAPCFYPIYTQNNTNTRSTNYALNPYAKLFVPLHMLLKKNCVIRAILVTLLFLLVLLLIIIISINTHEIDDMNPKDLLKKLKYDNPNKIIIGHLNINSIRSKFEFLKELIDNNIDIFLISETKLNYTFPSGQFLINGYHVPLRFDRNSNAGGILLYFRDHIPCKNVTLNFMPILEAIVVEINLKKRKWLLIGSYNPHKDMIQNHLNNIGKQLNDLCLKYDNFILIGDFNSEMHEDAMKVFCTTYNFKNLVKEPACFKNADNPNCIDLILTNKPLYF